MKTRFVILSSPRSGSSLFRLWLNSHRYIRCHGEVLLKASEGLDAIHEYFMRNSLQASAGCTYSKSSLDYPDDDFHNKLLEDYLEDLYTNRDRCGPWTTQENMTQFLRINDFDAEMAVGFKFMAYLLDNRFLKKWLATGTIHIIHLVRENSLKQLVSSVVASKRKVWHSSTEMDVVKVTLNPRMVLTFLQRMAAMNSTIERVFASCPYLKVGYEEFCSSQRLHQARVCDFLGVPPSLMYLPDMKKQNPVKLARIVDNYEEISAFLEGTSFRCFLD